MTSKLSFLMNWSVFCLVVCAAAVMIVDHSRIENLLVQTGEQVRDIRNTQNTVSLETIFVTVHDQAEHILKLDSILERYADTMAQQEEQVQLLESAVESASMQIKDLTDDNMALTTELEGANNQLEQLKEKIKDRDKELEILREKLAIMETE
jgi:peptidoglycan hydrolase CwlO-like protein